MQTVPCKEYVQTRCQEMADDNDKNDTHAVHRDWCSKLILIFDPANFSTFSPKRQGASFRHDEVMLGKCRKKLPSALS